MVFRERVLGTCGNASGGFRFCFVNRKWFYAFACAGFGGFLLVIFWGAAQGGGKPRPYMPHKDVDKSTPSYCLFILWNTTGNPTSYIFTWDEIYR